MGAIANQNIIIVVTAVFNFKLQCHLIIVVTAVFNFKLQCHLIIVVTAVFNFKLQCHLIIVVTAVFNFKLQCHLIIVVTVVFNFKLQCHLIILFYFSITKFVLFQFTGTAYGQGVYFATNSNYSCGYARPSGDGKKQMYLVLVLTGDYTRGSSAYRVTPDNPARPGFKFDSVVDDVSNPQMFVIFLDNQAYPKYLITFD